jgi:hypothetical protein
MERVRLQDPTPLDGEIEQLLAELRGDARFLRLEKLRRMRAEYLTLPAVEKATESAAIRPPGRKRSPERERALNQTFKLLQGKTSPTRLAEIDAHLKCLVSGWGAMTR